MAVQENNSGSYDIPDCVLPSALTRVLKDFTITTDSYISLCSRVYAATCSKNTDFAKDISESAFQYYVILILWKRFAQILPSSVQSRSEFFEEISHITSPMIPIPLLTYLKGIGHFPDPIGIDRQFSLPSIPFDEKIGGIRYAFGKVSAKSHAFYEAFPAPAIAVLRMLADVEYTNNPSETNLLWDLPEGLRPDVLESQVKSSKPTKNLLGWAPAQILTTNQLQLFESLKTDSDIKQNDFLITGEGFKELFIKIDEYFTDWDKSADDVNSGAAPLKQLPPMGSLIQGMSIERRHEFLKFDRTAMYCEGSLSVSSPYKLDDELNKDAVISGYRMAKEPICNRHCWSCYDFDEYKSVPESWVRSRNTIYMYGNVGRLNETVYSTGHITKKFLQNKCIQHVMFNGGIKWNIYQ